MTVEYQNIICKTRRSYYKRTRKVCCPSECKYKWVPLVDTCPAMDPILIIGTRVLLVGLSNSDTAVWISIEFDPCWNICTYIVLSLFSQCGLVRIIAISAILNWTYMYCLFLYYQRSLMKDLAWFFEVGQLQPNIGNDWSVGASTKQAWHSLSQSDTSTLYRDYGPWWVSKARKHENDIFWSFPYFGESVKVIDIHAVLGSPKKKEKTLEPTDRLWLLNHTKYKVTRKMAKN